MVGEPGAGKSRLLYELQERLGNRDRMPACCAPAAGHTATAFPTASSCRLCARRSNLEPPLRRGDDVVTAIRALDASLEPFLPLFLHLLSVSSAGHTLPRHLHGEHLQAALLDALATIVGVLDRARAALRARRGLALGGHRVAGGVPARGGADRLEPSGADRHQSVGPGRSGTTGQPGRRA